VSQYLYEVAVVSGSIVHPEDSNGQCSRLRCAGLRELFVFWAGRTFVPAQPIRRLGSFEVQCERLLDEDAVVRPAAETHGVAQQLLLGLVEDM